MIFDQEHMERQQAVDQAFLEGANYERRRTDETWLDECVELRLQLAEKQAAKYREGVEVGVFLTILGVAVIVAAGFIAGWLL